MSNYSAAPGTPQTSTKAVVATLLSAVAGFVTYWVADKDPFTAKEAGNAVLLAIGASGLTGGGTWVAQNKPKRR